MILRFVPLWYFPTEYAYIAVWNVSSDGGEESYTFLDIDGYPPGPQSVFEIIGGFLKTLRDQMRILWLGEDRSVVDVAGQLGVGCPKHIASVDGE